MSLLKRLPFVLLFLPLVVGAALVFFPERGTSHDVPAVSPLVQSTNGLSAEQLVFLLQYVGTDYPAAVSDGEVINDFEYQEMLEFSRTLLREYRNLRPGPDSEVTVELERLAAWVEEKRDPDHVLALTRELVRLMTRELHLTTYPARAPDIENGERLYAVACAQCHGDDGDGLGASAPGMEPPPTSFRGDRMRAVPPHQLYNAVGFGVEGTTMPSFDDAYSPAERWDLAFYLMTLRDDFDPEPPPRSVPLSLRELATRSDEELQAELEVPGGVLDYYRQEIPRTEQDELLRLAQQKLVESFAAYEQGDPASAVRLSLQAYLEGIEPTEAALASIDARLVREIERELALYRAELRQGLPVSEIAPRVDRVSSLAEEARTTLEGTRGSFGFAFLQSTTIILREGIEAALLVALLLSYLAAAGYPGLRRYIAWGAVGGVGCGLLTWFGAQYLVETSTLEREALEGITSLLAAAVLFSVSFWIVHHADLKRWKSYIEDRARTALGAGSGLALATVSFLAVYREAFETVLFYQALWLRSGSESLAIVSGLGVGTVVLAVIVVLMFRYGKRVPLKPFFAVTGVLLAVLAFVFAGYGIAELQKIGWIKETPLDWVPYVPFLELQPTLEGLSLQLGILFSFLLSWFLPESVVTMRQKPEPAGA